MLFSAYRDAGLLHILQYMRNDNKEWSKLLHLQHIDMATRNVKRLAQSFHLAFLLSFSSSLEPEDRHACFEDLILMKTFEFTHK